VLSRQLPTFDLETLSVILNKPIDETLSGLTSAIKEDYVSLFGDIYKFSS